MTKIGATAAVLLSLACVVEFQGIAAALTIELAGGGTELIAKGDSWQYFKGSVAPSAPADAWYGIDFTPGAGWLTGPSGFGYDDGDDATVLNDMAGNYRTVYIRKEFTLTPPIAEGIVELSIDYDDGFIAFLNGEEAARGNMPPGAATYQTNASAGHDAGTPERFALGSAADVLQAGKNVLAIEGHNNSLTSGDFSLIPILRLVSDTVQDGDHWVVGSSPVALRGTTSAAGAASVRINGVVAAFNPADGSWSGEAHLTEGANTVLVEALNGAAAVVDSGTIAIVYVPASNRFGGALAADTAWSGAVVVEEDLTVPAGRLLTIEAGTVVMLKPAVSIEVRGGLRALGTEGAPVRITHYGNGTTWDQIIFRAASASRFDHCIVEYADSAGDHQDYYVAGSRNYHEAIVVVASTVDFEGCTFQNLPNDGDAIAIFSDDPDVPGPSTSTIRGCRFTGIGQGIHERFSPIVVENCYFTGKDGDNDDVDLWGESTPPPIIRNNIFLNPAHDDLINPTRCSAVIIGNIIAGSDDHGLVLRDKGSPLVMNNLIYNCTAAGIAVENSCTATLINNTIFDCGRGLRLFDLGRWNPPYSLNPGGGTATVINCIIWNCPSPITLTDSSNTTIPDRGSHVTVMYSDVPGGRNGVVIEGTGTYSTTTWGEGNINANPLFVNSAQVDFHLQPASPAIDAGTADAWPADQEPATDLDGRPRPNGAGFDMGAYEYGEGAVPERFRRGDPNNDGKVDLSDAVTVLRYLFGKGPVPSCLKSADASDNGEVQVGDAIYLLGYLFAGTAAPPDPFGTCGVDLTPEGDTTTCLSYPPCP